MLNGVIYKILKKDSLEKEVENIILNNQNGDVSYHNKIKQFYRLYENKNDKKDLLMATIAKILSGDYRENNKRIWFWKDRINRIKELYDARKFLNKEQEVQTLIDILKKNKYLRRKHEDKIGELYNILSSYKNLDRAVKKRKIMFKRVLGYSCGIFLATYLFLAPKVHKIYSQIYNNKNNIIYVVKQGDNLWNITENYLRNKDFGNINDQSIYNYCNLIANLNGKGKQADYKISIRDDKSPHYIKPDQTFILPYIKN